MWANVHVVARQKPYAYGSYSLRTSKSMKLIGLLIIANALILTGWQVATGAGGKGVVSVCLIAVFVGLVLTFQDRITELSIKGVGTLKAATVEAESKLEAIERIKTRVEAQGATIDLVAKDAKEARQLTDEIKKKSEEVEKKVKEMDQNVERADKNTKELSAVLEFTNTVVAAQSDDRKAYDKLKAWADDPTFRYSKESLQAYVKVMDDHSSGMYSSGFTVPWSAEFDPAKLDLQALSAIYRTAPDHVKLGLIEYIWGRKDLTRLSRLDFLMSVIRTDSSLKAVEYAGRYFTQGTELKIKPVATDYLSQWWTEHRNEIKD